jgi:hypothetical protein
MPSQVSAWFHLDFLVPICVHLCPSVVFLFDSNARQKRSAKGAQTLDDRAKMTELERIPTTLRAIEGLNQVARA